jgi:hypothetical protein
MASVYAASVEERRGKEENTAGTLLVVVRAAEHIDAPFDRVPHAFFFDALQEADEFASR